MKNLQLTAAFLVLLVLGAFSLGRCGTVNVADLDPGNFSNISGNSDRLGLDDGRVVFPNP